MNMADVGGEATYEALPVNDLSGVRTSDTYPDLEESIQYLGYPGVNSLKDAFVVVAAAKAVAEPRPDESERVMTGTLIPDRRLPNDIRALEHILLRSVRRRFRVGELPTRSTAETE